MTKMRMIWTSISLLLISCNTNFFEERITFVKLEVVFENGNSNIIEYNYSNYDNLGPIGHHLEDGCLSIKGETKYCDVRSFNIISTKTECPNCK